MVSITISDVAMLVELTLFAYHSVPNQMHVIRTLGRIVLHAARTRILVRHNIVFRTLTRGCSNLIAHLLLFLSNKQFNTNVHSRIQYQFQFVSMLASNTIFNTTDSLLVRHPQLSNSKPRLLKTPASPPPRANDPKIPCWSLRIWGFEHDWCSWHAVTCKNKLGNKPHSLSLSSRVNDKSKVPIRKL